MIIPGDFYLKHNIFLRIGETEEFRQQNCHFYSLKFEQKKKLELMFEFPAVFALDDSILQMNNTLQNV